MGREWKSERRMIKGEKIGGLGLGDIQTGVTQQLQERQLQNKDNVDNKVVIY